MDACEAKLTAVAQPPQRFSQIQPSMSVRHGDRDWPIQIVLTWRNTSDQVVEIDIRSSTVAIYGAARCNKVYHPNVHLRGGGWWNTFGPYAELSETFHWRGQRTFRWETERNRHRIVLPGTYLVVGYYSASTRHGSDSGPLVVTQPLRFELPSTHWPDLQERTEE